jgi:hypothetical protein
MEYEYWFRVEKNEKNADFHVLGLCMAEKHDLSEKKFPYVTRRGRCR